jgi:hypothetical protein
MSKLKHILAIDPGASGGLVHYINSSTGNEIAFARKMPDDAEIVNIIRDFSELEGERVAYLELVGGYIGGAGAPGSAMFNFGDGYGYLRGCLAMAKVKTILVRPQKWQKGIPGCGGGIKGPERKRALKEHAARLFPDLTVTLATADALGIAHYAAQEERGGAKEPEEAAAPSVAILPLSHLPFKAQLKKAKAWAKRQGWGIPGKEHHVAMVNDWLKAGAP